jgi:acetyltransferase-like isoleucine patch superfamily enzyme
MKISKYIKYINFFKNYIIIFFNKKININGFPLIYNKVKFIVEEGARLEIGSHCIFKENTTIYVKKNASLSIGDNCSFGHNNEISIGGKATIGNDIITAPYVYITDQNHNYEETNKIIRLQKMYTKQINIGNDVWFGRQSMLLAGGRVASHVVIAANSLVNKPFSDNYIVLAGSPAKVIKKYK